MKKEKYVIDDPQLEEPARRKFEITLTFFAWAVSVYFLAPIATLALWAIGLRLVVLENFMMDHVAGLKSVIGYYFAGAVVIWVLFALWSRYNFRRFGGQDRRTHADPVTEAELVEHFGVTGDSLTASKQAKKLTIHVEEEGLRLAAD
jgi:poly-beta-1,6-N-acetyl-D-glucosamine biosynthesis protein PgaD